MVRSANRHQNHTCESRRYVCLWTYILIAVTLPDPGTGAQPNSDTTFLSFPERGWALQLDQQECDV